MPDEPPAAPDAPGAAGASGGPVAPDPDPEDLRGLLAGALSLLLQVFAATSVVAVVVAAVAARSTLDGRAGVVVGVVVAGSVAMWRWPGGWPGAFLLAGAGATASALCWVALAGRSTPAAVSGWTVGDRLLGRDVAPASAIVVWVAASSVAGAALALALPWRVPVASLGPRLRGFSVVAGLVAVMVAVAFVVGGQVTHDRLHRESEDLHRLSQRFGSARRVDDPVALPPRPTRPAWQAWTAPGTGEVLAVPGWDAVVVLEQQPDGWGGTASISALSVEDGSVLWSYQRFDGAISGVGVDPGTGRVLVVAGPALLVLDLADGGEVAVRRSPVGATAQLYGDRLARTSLALGATVVLTDARYEAPGEVALVEVAGGELLASAPNPHWECHYARTAGGAPLLLRWGPGQGCREPALLAVDAAGRDLVAAGGIDPPGGAWAGCTDPFCARTRLVGEAPAFTLALAWNSLAAGEPVVEEVAHLVDGRVAWRVPVIDDGAGGEAGGAALLPGPGAGGSGLVAEWGGTWRLLGPDDGTVAATVPVVHDDQAATGALSIASGGRVYSVRCGTLVVRGGDLRRAGTWPLFPDDCDPDAPAHPGAATLAAHVRSTTQVTGNGLLLVHDRQTGALLAYGADVDADPDAAPPEPATDRGDPGTP